MEVEEKGKSVEVEEKKGDAEEKGVKKKNSKRVSYWSTSKQKSFTVRQTLPTVEKKVCM